MKFLKTTNIIAQFELMSRDILKFIKKFVVKDEYFVSEAVLHGVKMPGRTCKSCHPGFLSGAEQILLAVAV